jgi:hypothetical protein
MKKIVITVMLGAFVLFGFSSIASAQCGTQGAFALALAQTLNIDVTTQEAARSELGKIGVQPDGGWSPTSCMNAEMVRQIQTALDNAVAAGDLTADQLDDALSIALASIGEGDLISAAGGGWDRPLYQGSPLGGIPDVWGYRIPKEWEHREGSEWKPGGSEFTKR